MFVKNYLISKLGTGREAEDIFPTHYKLNSRRQIAQIAKKYDLSFEIFRRDQPSGYLRRSLVLMLTYTAIHRPLQIVFSDLLLVSS